ncbi:MAG: hypothetical protein JNM31_08490 [Flavobacteriales bacterium]|nr:hypothetical protein [Flavobacteriales bacterium]
MVAALFRTDRPQGFVALPLLVLALTVPLGMRGWTPPAGGCMPFYQALIWLMEWHPWLPAVLSGMAVLIVAVQAGALANEIELFGRRTRLPLLHIPVLLGLWPAGVALDPVLAGMPAALLAVRAIWARAGRSKSITPWFEAGLWAGVAALFQVQYVFLVVAVWTSTAVLHPFRWRAYLLPLLGVALPLYLTWGGHVLIGSSWRPLSTMLVSPVQWSFPNALYVILGVALMTLLLVATLGAFAASYQRANLRGKNVRAAFLGLFLVLGVMAALGAWLTGELAPAWIGVPLGLFVCFPFTPSGYGAIKEVAAWCLLLLALWCQWAGTVNLAA